MYLKRFCNNSNQLYAYDKKEKRGCYNLPRAFAHEKFFYDLDTNTLKEILEKYFSFDDDSSIDKLSKIQVIENLLGQIEGTANSVLNKLDAEPSALLDENVQFILIYFIHLLSSRTVAQRRKIKNIHSKRCEVFKELGISTNPQMIKYCNMTPEEYSKKCQIERMISPAVALKFADMLMRKYDWYYGIVNSRLKLIISDNPAEIISHGFNDCCFPISPNKAIIFRAKGDDVTLISNDTPKNGIINLSTQSVFAYDVMQKAYSERFLFGDEISIQYLLYREYLFNYGL